MKNNIQKATGTQDFIGEDAQKWLQFVQRANKIFSFYGYEYIETPAFENAHLFVRGCGEDTDVATKEIYYMMSRKSLLSVIAGEKDPFKKGLALRPEGTASVVRAAIENNLISAQGSTAKLFYAGSMFRCERPQKGRYREFKQVGAECLAATDVASDAEVILMCMQFFEAIGFDRENIKLLVNSMGCEECRAPYEASVADYLRANLDGLCDDCKARAAGNPLRAFDCKNEACAAIMQNAPKFSDNLCDTCRSDFNQLLAYLDDFGIVYTIDPSLVRGFDYYTKTVFEFQVDAGLGVQNAIGGGGRYNKLSAELGGPDVPGIGFALGFARCMLALTECGRAPFDNVQVPVSVCATSDALKQEAFKIAQNLRKDGIAATVDLQGKSLKGQLKQAGKSGAKYCVIVGEDEFAAGEVQLKNMETSLSSNVAIDELSWRLPL
ncbi:MAG: histidine--tRNA ligase [Coriobacteriales bacterium]|nr:histidine--tRNA ligase [Coriobacteriales bacterium]